MIVIMLSLFNAIDAPKADLRFIDAGQHLFHMNDPVSALHEVISGEITLERVSAHGTRLVLQRAREGALVAEASIYADAYHCDAIAMVPSEVRSYSIVAVHSFLQSHPDVLSQLTRHFAHQVQQARYRAEMLSLRRVADRLEAWLLMTGGPLPLKGEWTALAAEIGVTPEALYRELALRKANEETRPCVFE
jgi:CRP/FNR family transcriptional regulator, dissimilatory nitrate respiration regulator